MTKREQRLSRTRNIASTVCVFGMATFFGICLTEIRQPWLVWPVWAVTTIAGVTASVTRVLLLLRD